jgi:hypothetical protein
MGVGASIPLGRLLTTPVPAAPLAPHPRTGKVTRTDPADGETDGTDER